MGGELSASYAIAGSWRIGIGGYALQRLSDPKTDAARIHDSPEASGVRQSARWSHGGTMVIASAYKEFEAETALQTTWAVRA